MTDLTSFTSFAAATLAIGLGVFISDLLNFGFRYIITGYTLKKQQAYLKDFTSGLTQGTSKGGAAGAYILSPFNTDKGKSH